MRSGGVFCFVFVFGVCREGGRVGWGVEEGDLWGFNL